jgi:hypothetical protein
VYRRLLLGLVVLSALVGVSQVHATEPDGRFVIRYSWPDRTETNPDASRLRLSLTAVVDMTDAQLTASIPAGVALTLREPGKAPQPWTDQGLPLGQLSRGQIVLIDFDVAKPATGGGILGFALRASAGGFPVHEGVGVVVGHPGTAPTFRNGAMEFRAARAAPSP